MYLWFTSKNGFGLEVIFGHVMPRGQAIASSDQK